MIVQLFSLIGAFALLSAFFINNTEVVKNKDRALWLNFVGAFILTITAYIEHQYGFIILEGSWTLISLHSIVKYLRRKK